MPTVIDELVIQLGLDASKFTEAQKQAMAQFKQTQEQAVGFGKEVESSGKKLGEFFTTLKREAVGVFAAFFGARGITELLTNLTKLDAATGRMAVTMGMSTRDLSAWQRVAERTGGTAEGMTGAMQALTDQVEQFRLTGTSQILPILNQLGISMTDVNGRIFTAGELFLKISDAIKGMDPREARALMLNMGIPTDVINTLLVGAQRLKELHDEEEKLRSATEASSKQSIALADAWARASGEAEQMGRQLRDNLAPWLITVLNGFERLFFLGTDQSASVWASLGRRLDKLFGTEKEKGYGAPFSSKGLVGSTGVGGPSAAEVREYYRAGAIARGLNPGPVLATIAGESGFDVGAVGDDNTSFGAAQLHYGGGLGDVFTRTTGLQASDPTTWKQQADFTLDQMKKGGLGPWHAWVGDPWAAARGGLPSGMPPAAGPTTNSSSTVNIQNMNVYTPDAASFARGDIRPMMQRGSVASQFNGGAQ